MSKWPFLLALLGLVIPFFVYRLSRRVGIRLLLASAGAIGVAYGALKAENPWFGVGLARNLIFMAGSALAALAYVGLAVAAAGLVARAASSFRA